MRRLPRDPTRLRLTQPCPWRCPSAFAPSFDRASTYGRRRFLRTGRPAARPPEPRGPRSGRVVLSRPSTLSRPHPPVRRTPRPFPLPVIDAVLDIRGSSCLFSAPSGLSLLLNCPGLPPSLRRGTQCVLLSSSASALAIGWKADPWHPRNPHKSASLRGQRFAASYNRSLSLRPSGLLTTLADRTRREPGSPPSPRWLLRPSSLASDHPETSGICYGAKLRIAPAGLPPASSAARLAARFSPAQAPSKQSYGAGRGSSGPPVPPACAPPATAC